MTIKLTHKEFLEHFQEADKKEIQSDLTDELDSTFKFNARFAKGWKREICLRTGIFLDIRQFQNKERVICTEPEGEFDDITFTFLLSGNEQWSVASALSETSFTRNIGEYLLASPGSRGELTIDRGTKLVSQVYISVPQAMVRSFATSRQGGLPDCLQRLFGLIHQDIYRHVTSIQPTTTAVLQQIVI